MTDLRSPSRCPALAGACAANRPCREALPQDGAGRAAIMVLRFVAAARETGDACCWDAALDHAEAAFGETLGPLVVGRVGALVRRLAGLGAAPVFLPPPCRRLSSGEALLLDALRAWLPDLARLEPALLADPHAALARSFARAADPSALRAA